MENFNLPVDPQTIRKWLNLKTNMSNSPAIAVLKVMIINQSKTIYYSLVCSHLTNLTLIWSRAAQKQIFKLEVLQNIRNKIKYVAKHKKIYNLLYGYRTAQFFLTRCVIDCNDFIYLKVQRKSIL